MDAIKFFSAGLRGVDESAKPTRRKTNASGQKNSQWAHRKSEIQISTAQKRAMSCIDIERSLRLQDLVGDIKYLLADPKAEQGKKQMEVWQVNEMLPYENHNENILNWTGVKEKVRYFKNLEINSIMNRFGLPQKTAINVRRFINKIKEGVLKKRLQKASQLLQESLVGNSRVITNVKSQEEAEDICYISQANAEMNEVGRLHQRIALRENAVLQSIILDIWNNLPKCPKPHNQFIDKQVYQWASARMIDCFTERAKSVNHHSRLNLLRNIDREWFADSNKEFFMNYVAFFNAVFGVIDIWCDTTDIAEYAELAKKIREKLLRKGEFSYSTKLAERHWDEWLREIGCNGDGWLTEHPKRRVPTPLSPEEFPFTRTKPEGVPTDFIQSSSEMFKDLTFKPARRESVVPFCSTTRSTSKFATKVRAVRRATASAEALRNMRRASAARLEATEQAFRGILGSPGAKISRRNTTSMFSLKLPLCDDPDATQDEKEESSDEVESESQTRRSTTSLATVDESETDKKDDDFGNFCDFSSCKTQQQADMPSRWRSDSRHSTFRMWKPSEERMSLSKSDSVRRHRSVKNISIGRRKTQTINTPVVQESDSQDIASKVVTEAFESQSPIINHSKTIIIKQELGNTDLEKIKEGGHTPQIEPTADVKYISDEDKHSLTTGKSDSEEQPASKKSAEVVMQETSRVRNVTSARSRVSMCLENYQGGGGRRATRIEKHTVAKRNELMGLQEYATTSAVCMPPLVVLKPIGGDKRTPFGIFDILPQQKCSSFDILRAPLQESLPTNMRNSKAVLSLRNVDLTTRLLDRLWTESENGTSDVLNSHPYQVLDIRDNPNLGPDSIVALLRIVRKYKSFVMVLLYNTRISNRETIRLSEALFFNFLRHLQLPRAHSCMSEIVSSLSSSIEVLPSLAVSKLMAEAELELNSQRNYAAAFYTAITVCLCRELARRLYLYPDTLLVSDLVSLIINEPRLDSMEGKDTILDEVLSDLSLRFVVVESKIPTSDAVFTVAGCTLAKVLPDFPLSDWLIASDTLSFYEAVVIRLYDFRG